MRPVPLKLGPGSDLHRSLVQLGRAQNAPGFVLGVVGNLSQVAFQCPGPGGPTVLQGDFEIISLQGTVGPEGVHLHLSFSDGDCQVWGGHLEPGSLVLKGADLLVGVLAEPAPAEQPAPAAGQSAPATGQPRVAIAVRPGCPYSARALRMLRTLGIPHALVEPRAEGSVPQVFIDGVFIGGYDALAERHGRGELTGLR
ncbi:PCC domain-containing protein [Vulcanococcus limneticus]|uniref:PCC domain-containing protein n=1 Tax=Vulcanococcus limneticus TaxID=2170428 RepID=UPI00398BC88F